MCIIYALIFITLIMITNTNMLILAIIMILVTSLYYSTGFLSLISSLMLFYTMPVFLTVYLWRGYGFLASLPLLYLIDSASKRFSEKYSLNPPNIFIKNLSITPLSLLFIALTLLPLTLIDLWISISSFTIIIYIILKSSYRLLALKKVRLDAPKVIKGIRGERQTIELSAINNSKVGMLIIFSDYEGVGSCDITPKKVKVNPSSSEEIRLEFTPSSAGKYGLKISFNIVDNELWVKRTLIHSIMTVVSTKTSIAVHVAQRLLRMLKPLPMTGLEIESEGPTKVMGGEFYGCREYIPGDDPRNINMKKSVSKQTMIINEYWSSGIGPLAIIADLTANSPEELDDLMYKVISLAIYSVFSKRPNVTLVAYNSRGIIKSIPRQAPRNILIMLLDLAEYAELLNITDSNLDEPDLRMLKEASKRDDAIAHIAKIELELLITAFKISPHSKALIKVKNIIRPPAEVTIIRSPDKQRWAHAILRHYLEEMGYKIVEIPHIPIKLITEIV